MASPAPAPSTPPRPDNGVCPRPVLPPPAKRRRVDPTEGFERIEPRCCTTLREAVTRPCSCFEYMVEEEAAYYDFGIGTDMDLWKKIILDGTLARISLLLDYGFPAEVRFEISGYNLRYHEAPLEVAAYHGRIDVLCLLLDHGADPHATTSDGETMLMIGCGHPSVITRLLQCGVDPRATTPKGDTVWTMIRAVVKDPLPSIQALVKGGASLSDIEDAVRLRFALNSHSKHQALQILTWLLDHGVTIHPTSEFDFDPLCMAIQKRRTACAMLLLERGASPHGTNPSPLYLAVAQRDFAMVKALLARGVDPNAKGVQPRSCYHGRMPRYEPALHACFWKVGTCYEREVDVNFLRLLLHCGADVDATNDDGETAFWMACKHFHVDCMDVLYQAGANLQVEVPVRVPTCGMLHGQVRRVLGRDPVPTDVVVTSPLMYSMRGENKTVFRWLLYRGATLDPPEGSILTLCSFARDTWFIAYLDKVEQHRRVDTIHAVAPIAGPDIAALIADLRGP